MNAVTTQRGTAEKVAEAIIKSGFWQGANAHAVLLMCYLAEAEGKHPAIVYRDYHMMSGKPSKKADAMLSDFVAAGGKVEWHALDDDCADATFSHAAGSARIMWTMDRAKQAGIARNAMWGKYPRQMLRSRTISEGVRTVYPGATSGLYEEGEVADIVASEAPVTPHQAADEGQSQNGEVSPPAANTLSDADWAKIVTLCQATKTQGDEVKNHIGAENLRRITPEQFDLAVEYLNKKLPAKSATLADELADEIKF